MPLESGDTIADLNPLWPLGSDPKSQGDDHLRLIKTVLQNDVYPKEDIDAALTGYSRFGEIPGENLPTGGTSAQITGIPDWANHVEIAVSLLSASTSGSLSMRLGGAAGIASSGYSSTVQRLVAGSASTGSTNSAQFLFAWGLNSANSYTGLIKLHRYLANIWTMQAQGLDGPGNVYIAAGRVSLGSDVLSRFTLFTGGGNITGGGAGVRFWQ